MTRRSDVVVVGGGAIGCAVAWALVREGVSVTLLEREAVAAQASGAAAGMLLPFGESGNVGPFFRWAQRSLALFPQLCEELYQRSGVDPELERTGALYAAGSEPEEVELRARAERFAAHGLEWLDAPAARELEPALAPGLRGALWSPGEAHLRSPLLARALAAAAATLGARIETGVPVTGLRRQGDRVTGVETAGGALDAGRVILCAGAWTPALLPRPLPIEPVRGQILSLDAPRPGLRRIVVGRGAYLVPKRDASIVVGATQERVGFDRRVTAAGMSQLLAAAPLLVPALAEAGFRHGWAGLRPATPDGLPLIGSDPQLEGLVLAAGHFRNGILLAPITAQLVADLVQGKGLPGDAAVFRPGRFAESR